MIELNETLIDLATACKLPVFRNPKTGKACGIASLYRYVLRGARAANGERIRLETIRTPNGMRTSTEAVERFIRLLTNPEVDLPNPRSTTRSKQIADADRELEAAGFTA